MCKWVGRLEGRWGEGAEGERILGMFHLQSRAGVKFDLSILSSRPERNQELDA